MRIALIGYDTNITIRPRIKKLTGIKKVSEV